MKAAAAEMKAAAAELEEEDDEEEEKKEEEEEEEEVKKDEERLANEGPGATPSMADPTLVLAKLTQQKAQRPAKPEGDTIVKAVKEAMAVDNVMNLSVNVI